MLSHLNVGTGLDCSIAELAQTMQAVVGFGGALRFDTSKPDGTPRKLLDVGRLAGLGWQASIPLRDGTGGNLRLVPRRGQRRTPPPVNPPHGAGGCMRTPLASRQEACRLSLHSAFEGLSNIYLTPCFLMFLFILAQHLLVPNCTDANQSHRGDDHD